MLGLCIQPISHMIEIWPLGPRLEVLEETTLVYFVPTAKIEGGVGIFIIIKLRESTFSM